MTQARAEAFRFFCRHAGYHVGYLAECALQLTKAEEAARRADVRFEWVDDPDADWSWMDEDEASRDHEVYGCVLRDADGNVLASLWGIFDPSPEYRRVVQAELALEAEDALRTVGAGI